jgi:hypothetical protein
MSTEIVRQQTPNLRDQMDFARALATADLLPPQFRGRPGDVLLAMELGRSLNLPVAQVFAAVSVVEGKPTISAELMQALVRRAGHRIRIEADETKAQCTIWRTEDPDFAWVSTFTMADARRAGLAEKRNWQRYPKPMLIARAVSACCRLACPDVLAGVSYTPEELGAQIVDAPTGSDEPAASSDLANNRFIAQTVSADESHKEGANNQFFSTSSRDGESATEEAVSRDDRADADRSAPLDEQPQPDTEVEQYRADWLGRLDEALDSGDLQAVQDLASQAATAGHADLVDQARAAWSTISGRRTMPAPKTDRYDNDEEDNR